MSVWIWSLAFVSLVGFFLWQCWGRWQVLSLARGDDGRDYGSQSSSSRVQNTLIYAFGQLKFYFGEQPSGIMHIVIFYGFLILGIQVVTMFVRGWIPDFHVPGFGASYLGRPYALMKDIFQALVIVAGIIGIYRWAILKPTRLMGFLPAEQKLRNQSHAEAILILFFILTIMLSGFFYDAARIVLLPDHPSVLAEQDWQPISRRLAGFMSLDSAQMWASVSWWVHNLVILVFMNLLPRSKHFHIITAIPNVFFGKVGSKGHLPKKDFEAEDALFGTSQINHFTKKQVLDMYSCTECGRCSSVCPATDSGKPLAPRQLLLNLRDSLYANQDKLIAANGSREAEFDPIVGPGAVVDDEVIWSCNTCRACEEACPVNIEYIDKIVDIRQHLVQEAARFPEELNNAFKGLENQSNPWGISAADRANWVEELPITTMEENPNAEYLYYVGCGNAFDQNNKKNSRAFIKILNASGVSYGIMGAKELCNGETARRLGNEYLYQTMAEQLAAQINSYGVKKIIVNCPHCFNTMKNEYPDYGGDWEIIRAADFVNNLIEDGKIKIKEEGEQQKVVYHDSCYYGRINDVYDEPRKLIRTIPGAYLEEMKQSKANSKCCGAGGGRMWLEEDKDKRVNIQRIEQALETKPNVIATSCPFCKIMLGSALNDKGESENVQIKDVMEIVSENMVDAPAPQP